MVIKKYFSTPIELGCLICGSKERVYSGGTYPGHLMTVLCKDNILRQIHGGVCAAKYSLSDLSSETEEYKLFSKRYLEDVSRNL